ncbi:MAG: Lsr2 family protein [Propionibacteriaceae bacterium]|nr:Lsr2 family protein [Propionibacteriaceae bacterium]
MAKRTEVVLIDDIDGSLAESSIEFSLEGVTYGIDLSAQNAAELRGDFAKWIEKSRRVSGRRRAARRASAGNSDIAAIRAWAQDNGYEVSARGRISAKVREAYLAAN